MIDCRHDTLRPRLSTAALKNKLRGHDLQNREQRLYELTGQLVNEFRNEVGIAKVHQEMPKAKKKAPAAASGAFQIDGCGPYELRLVNPELRQNVLRILKEVVCGPATADSHAEACRTDYQQSNVGIYRDRDRVGGNVLNHRLNAAPVVRRMLSVVLQVVESFDWLIDLKAHRPQRHRERRRCRQFDDCDRLLERIGGEGLENVARDLACNGL